MDKKAYEIRLNEWIGLIRAANDSGLTRSEWCRQNGITKRRYYYWQNKVRDYLIEAGMATQNTAAPVPSGPSSLMEQPIFCEIREPAVETVLCSTEHTKAGFKTDAVINYGPISVFINEDTSDRTLAKLISAFRNDI